MTAMWVGLALWSAPVLVALIILVLIVIQFRGNDTDDQIIQTIIAIGCALMIAGFVSCVVALSGGQGACAHTAHGPMEAP